MQARDGAKHRPAAGGKRPGHDGISDGWTSPRLFVRAAAEAAIGFDNFWQFPAITAQYGAAASLIVYLAGVALLGRPLLMAEIMLGRRGRAAPITTFRRNRAAATRTGSWSAGRR